MSDVVRLAEDNDLKKCVVLALDMIREGYYKDYDIDEVEMTHHAKRAFHQPDWMFLVYEKDDEVVGFFSAQITKTFFGHAGFDIIAKRLGYDYVGPMYGRTP